MPTREELYRLESECDVESLRRGGPGGQHQNKTESAVRISHRPTGIVVVAAESRSQYQNKIAGLLRLWRRLEELRRPKKTRVATRPSRGSKERRIEAKKLRSRLKRGRGDSGWE